MWLENDADTAGLGEYYYGSGRGADRLVILTVGTGVGGAVILDGEIYRGFGGEHPEFGHMPISFDGPACYCGRNGCLESLISGPAIADAGRPLGHPSGASVFVAAAAADAPFVLIIGHQPTLGALCGLLLKTDGLHLTTGGFAYLKFTGDPVSGKAGLIDSFSPEPL